MLRDDPMTNAELNEKIVIRPDDLVRQKAPTAPLPSPLSRHASLITIAIAAILSLVVIMVGFVVMLNWRSPPEASASATERSSRQSNATSMYWNELRRIDASLDLKTATWESDNPGSADAQLQEQRAAIGNAIGEILRLPVLDVDQDALDVGSKMAEFLSEFDALLVSMERLRRDAEAFGIRSTSTETLVESLVRGFLGDPLGTTNELRAEHGALSERHQQILAQAQGLQRKANDFRIFGSRVRANLTARFGSEFPPLE